MPAQLQNAKEPDPRLFYPKIPPIPIPTRPATNPETALPPVADPAAGVVELQPAGAGAGAALSQTTQQYHPPPKHSPPQP